MGVDNEIEAYDLGVRTWLWIVSHIMHKTQVTSVQTASGLALASWSQFMATF